jgi:hypothetical protein
MSITVPVFGATEERNVEPAVPGMRVILAVDAERYDHNPAAMEDAGDGPGTVIAVLADRAESPLLIEWPSGARSFHRAAALVALGWPVDAAPTPDRHSPAKTDAMVDADWDADGGISIGRTIGTGFSSLGFTVEQASRIHSQLTELLGLSKPELLPMPEVTEEDDYFTLGQELASIADRELRVAVAFLRGLNTMQLDALQTTTAAEPDVRDARGNQLYPGRRVHRLSDMGVEGSLPGTVVALLPDGVSVRWGQSVGVVVTAPRKLVVI